MSRVITGIRAHGWWISMKAHFRDEMDITKYNLKPSNKVKTTTYNGLCERPLYESLAKKSRTDQYILELLLSNFIDLPNEEYIKEFMDDWDKRKMTHIKWSDRMKSFKGRLFKKDFNHLLKENIKWDDSIGDMVTGEYLNKRIYPETFIIIKNLMPVEQTQHNTKSLYKLGFKNKVDAYSKIIKFDLTHYSKVIEKMAKEHK